MEGNRVQKGIQCISTNYLNLFHGLSVLLSDHRSLTCTWYMCTALHWSMHVLVSMYTGECVCVCVDV